MYSYKVRRGAREDEAAKMSGSQLEDLLNEHARLGWRLKAITST